MGKKSTVFRKKHNKEKAIADDKRRYSSLSLLYIAGLGSILALLISIGAEALGISWGNTFVFSILALGGASLLLILTDNF